jgi:ADP-heptose:LPS heptosyltransferase
VKFISTFFKLIFFYICDGFVGMLPGRGVREGLIIFRLDAIGDFVIWLDSAKEYRRLYPTQKITVCLNSVMHELASSFPYWDEVISIDLKKFSLNLRYRMQVLRSIRRSSFEIAIQPTFSRSFSLGDALIRASRATQRIGSVGDLSNLSHRAKGISDRWYTRLVPACQAPMMELERNAEFIGNLCGQAFAANLPVLPPLKRLPDRLKVDGPFFIVFPGASWNGRQWPTPYFIDVLTKVYRQYGWLPVVCGGLGESALCQSIVDASPNCTVNLGGKTSLSELVELIRDAEILIGNETSAVHIATAVATPSVCILGGGHFGRFMPYPRDIMGIKPFAAYHEMPCYNCNWNCTQTFEKGCAVPCVAGVTVANVLQGVSKAINQCKFTESASNDVIDVQEK